MLDAVCLEDAGFHDVLHGQHLIIRHFQSAHVDPVLKVADL